MREGKEERKKGEMDWWKEKRNLPNHCHCAVDHQSFGDLGRSLVSDIIPPQPERRR
jgi:hypothetical protein